MQPTLTRILFAFFIALWVCNDACAHHSYAMFDRSKKVTLTGTIQQFQMVNPHSWLDIIVTDVDGKQQTWSFEGGSYTQLIRLGVRPSTFKVGDKVTVSAYPLRDGRNGGHVLTVTTADGKVIETFPAGS